MKVGIPKEIVSGETRVALIPDTVKRIVGKGMEVVVETGAGAGSKLADDLYEKAGASIAPSREDVLGQADLVLKVQPPRVGEDGGPNEVLALKEGGALLSFLQPFQRSDMVKQLAERNVTAMGMEMVPRITRAQNMDALSSMATCAGYKAVLIAANQFTRFMPMLTTAAGTIPPARVLVLGAGVAGLQAIATAKRLGAQVEAFDTRPVVKEQVESLGAKFIELGVDHAQAQDAGGYAKELDEEHQKKELELIASRMPQTDIVISTAQIPGKRAPVLITADMVQQLGAGSIIVDLAAEGGGNCELTAPGEVVTQHDVTIVGTFNLPALMPTHASQMYSKNMQNILNLLVKDGEMVFNMDDEVVAGIVVTRGGQVVHPALKS